MGRIPFRSLRSLCCCLTLVALAITTALIPVSAVGKDRSLDVIIRELHTDTDARNNQMGQRQIGALVIAEPGQKPESQKITVPQEGQSGISSFDNITFDFDSAVIKEQSKSQLQIIKQALSSTKLKTKKFLVIGYTDSEGSEEYNLKLSLRRADSVVRYLESQGIDRNRLTPVGAGEKDLVYDSTGKENPAASRRVVFVVKQNTTSGPQRTAPGHGQGGS